MTAFEWKGKDLKTWGDIAGAIVAIRDEGEANSFWAKYVTFLSRPDADLQGAMPEAVASSNIGYLMGYYGDEERRRVYALFPRAVHPVFGANFGRGGPDPTPAEAFAAGQRWMQDDGS